MTHGEVVERRLLELPIYIQAGISIRLEYFRILANGCENVATVPLIERIDEFSHI